MARTSKKQFPPPPQGWAGQGLPVPPGVVIPPIAPPGVVRVHPPPPPLPGTSEFQHHQQAAALYHQQAQAHAAAAAAARQAVVATQGDGGALQGVAAAVAQDAPSDIGDDAEADDGDVANAKTGPVISQLYVCSQCGKGLKSQAGLTSHLQHCDPEKVRAELNRNPQEKALKINTKRREKWEANFAALEAYKEEHRHCKVPANDPTHLQLGRWVSSIRREYKKRQEGKKNQLTDERVLKLVSIGFDFSVHGTNWDLKYQELLEYKARHGDCNVPLKYKENQPLAIWVHRQRIAHRKRFEEGKKSGMSDERIAALDKVGFDWSIDKPTLRPKHVSWDERIVQLQAFKDEHGNCRVPRGPDDGTNSLGNWVALVRFNYRTGVKTLTDERKKQLEEMGFEWRLKGRDMTAEERAEKKKEKAETELRRQVKREVRKRKLVPLDTTKTKKTRTARGAATTSKGSGGKKKDASDKIRTYFGHVPRPAEDGGPPALPALPPGGWSTSNREQRVQAARRAAEYYGRMAKAWEDIALEEEEGELQEEAAALNVEEGKVDNISDKPADVEYASASEGYAADESEAV
mmetsp:Transcript_34547/g.75625  ORF Transcript_34547/g.75625 Transcript_34547/m.75625 type:complete len:576 (-) Transcript_34547:147-1874(-)